MADFIKLFKSFYSSVGNRNGCKICSSCHKATEHNEEECVTMKKKKICIACSILLVAIILCSILYVGIGSNHVENKMWEYLEEENYSETDIYSIKVKHSFTNIVLSYNEWIIEVVYEDELTSTYKYTIKDGKIVESGVSGTTSKEDLKH